MFHFIIYLYYLTLRELSKFTVPLWKKQQNWLDSAFSYAENFMGWESTFEFINENVSVFDNDFEDFENDERIIMLSNHVNLCDIFTVLNMVRKNFPEHIIIGVTKKHFANIPLIGKYMAQCSILLDDNKTKNDNNNTINDNDNENCELINKNEYEIIKQIETLTKDCKSVIVLFPEGTVYWDKAIEKSNNWCNKLNINCYENVLAPRYKALYSLLKYYNPNSVLMNHLIYTDDLENKKGMYYSNFLTGNLPKKSKMVVKNFSNIIDIYNVSRLESTDEKQFLYFESAFYNNWRTVDQYISNMRIKNIINSLKSNTIHQ